MKKYKPTQLTVGATNQCNYHCVFCARSYHDCMQNSKEISISTVQYALNKYSSIKSANIAGFGEPLLYSRLEELIGLLQSKNILIRMSTNASMVHKRHNILKDLDIFEITVSLNSVNQLSYEKAHNVSYRFDNVINNIIWLKNNTNTDINISYVVHKDNYQQIPTMLDYADICDSISLYNILPHKPENFSKIIMKKDKDIMREIESYKKHRNINKVKIWLTPLDLSKERGKCRSPYQHLAIFPDGLISGCARISIPQEENGVIFDKEPFNNKHYRYLRNNLKKERKCKYCFGNYE